MCIGLFSLLLNLLQLLLIQNFLYIFDFSLYWNLHHILLGTVIGELNFMYEKFGFSKVNICSQV